MKKIQILIVVAVLAVFSCNQPRTTFEINGTVKGAEENTPVILYTAEDDTLAVTKVVNGKFFIEGTIAQPTDAYLTFGNPYASVILENEVYEADIDFEDRSSFDLKGGNLNTKINGYKSDPKHVTMSKELQELGKQGSDIDDNDKAAVAQFMKVYQEKSNVTRDIQTKYLQDILNSDAPVIEKYYALKAIQSGYTYDERIAMTQSYKKEYGDNPNMDSYISALQDIQKSLEAAKTVALGDQYKDVFASTNAGEEIKLSTVLAKNEYVLLEFWASWCGPCRSEFPHLKKAYEHYNSKGFEIYGLSIDDSKEKWLKAENEENIPWISIVDLNGRESQPMKDYGVLGIPASFLISKDGTIVASGMEVRGSGLDEKLKELFGE